MGAGVDGSDVCLSLCLNVSRPQSMLGKLSWDRDSNGFWVSVCSLTLHGFSGGWAVSWGW